MQFQTIIAVLSLAFVATAVPTTPTTTVSQCNQSGGDLRCCNGKGTGGLLNLNLQCDLPIVNLLSNLGCKNGQALNCCKNTGNNGINILSNNCVAIGSVL